MNDYPTPDGVFLQALDRMPDAFKMPFISIEGLAKATAAGNGSASEPKPKNKVKYSCPNCATNIWAKPNINAICGDCDEIFMPPLVA